MSGSVRPVFVEDTRPSTISALDTILLDLKANKINLSATRTMSFTGGLRTKAVVGETEVHYEPVGHIVGDNDHVIIAYRDATGSRYGYGYYDDKTNICRPVNAIDVVGCMAPKHVAFRMEHRFALFMLLVQLSRPRTYYSNNSD